MRVRRMQREGLGGLGSRKTAAGAVLSKEILERVLRRLAVTL